MMKKLNIVIPTINRKDLLLEALMSINKQLDYFEKILIIDNGHQTILPSIRHFNFATQGKLDFCETEANLGVSASWNLGIDKYQDSDYILFLNDDVVIGENQLKEIHEKLLDVKPFWLATGNCLWSMFTMAKPCWEHFLKNDGHVFDAKFFPAYYEDNDFHYRLVMALKKLFGEKSLHVGVPEMNPTLFRNSMTIKKDPKINTGFRKNGEYYKRKWGGTPGHERFTKPFNK